MKFFIVFLLTFLLSPLALIAILREVISIDIPENAKISLLLSGFICIAAVYCLIIYFTIYNHKYRTR